MKVSACPAVQEHISRKAARMREHRLDFPVSPCPYPAGSASLKRAIFVRNCRTHGKMRAGWSGVFGILYNYRFPDSSSLHKNFAYLLTFLLGYSIIRIIGTA